MEWFIIFPRFPVQIWTPQLLRIPSLQPDAMAKLILLQIEV
jgi:hypothetical protein